ncbi:hypothetical protein DQ04_10431000 [Trypanosoma grayi]|uniref:hypothetical protein n=1 Tax=Trypanosoma grayi TaxID=71804 RepID=UPI0004F4B59A|nr:hypothetical protein DQ04_10431000 [Trypanosoma grayi]KEG07248.1 hypothetical protein DQ04_10431000 [Trypanosoma grayi]
MKLGLSLITLAVQVLVLGLMVFAMLVPTNGMEETDSKTVYCINFWASGVCTEHASPISKLECSGVKGAMQAGAAFSIISMVLSVAVVVLLILRGKFSGSNWAPRIAAMLCAIAILIVLVVILIAMGQHCTLEAESSGNTVVFDTHNGTSRGLGLGFILVCIALVLEIVVAILSFVF